MDIAAGGDDTGGEDEFGLGDIDSPEMDASGRGNFGGRPPSIRKGELNLSDMPSWLIVGSL